MQLIARYRNAGFEALADGVLAFFAQRPDLQRPGVAFGPDGAEPAKVSTDISLVAIDRSDPEAFALAEVILRGCQPPWSTTSRSGPCSATAARSSRCS